MKKLMFAAVATFSIACAYGAGFGIYEASARGNAMGGAVVGDVSDATANYHNPANLAFSTNIMVAAGLFAIACDGQCRRHAGHAATRHNDVIIGRPNRNLFAVFKSFHGQ